MKLIHPEIIRKEVEDNKLCEGMWAQAIATSISWREVLTQYMPWVVATMLASIQNKKEDDAHSFLGNAFMPPLKKLISMCTYPNSYHMLTRLQEYSDLCLAYATAFTAGHTELVPKMVDAIQIHNISMYSFIMWDTSARKTYTITKDLADALRATSLKQYQAEWLRAPSVACYIEFPKGEFNFTTYSDTLTPSETGYVSLPVEGVYLLEDTTPVGMRLWRLVVVCQYKEPPSAQVQINHYYIPLRDGDSIDHCVAESIEMMQGKKHCTITTPNGEKSVIGKGHDGGWGWDSKITKCSEEIFRFVMNAVIYITREDADLTFVHVSPEYERFRARMLKAKGDKREELKQRMKHLDPTRRTLVGKSYTIKRWEKTLSSEGGEGRHITVRTLVSGHWRNQPCGAGHLDRKVIWIEPFWRGPEAAPLTEKRAVVK